MLSRSTTRPLRTAAVSSLSSLQGATGRINLRIQCNSSLKSAPLQPLTDKGELQLYKLANLAGVYAVYNKEETLQYIGLSRKIDASVTNHMQELPDLTHAVKVLPVESSARDVLVDAWKGWVEQAVADSGVLPPGNAPGETKWQSRKAAPLKNEIRLTAGKAINVTIETLIEQVVKTNKILNESKVDFEVVNVLDEVYNPGLREAIKAFSQWPTIPQLYVKGEFVGGADIVDQMNVSGELIQLLR